MCVHIMYICLPSATYNQMVFVLVGFFNDWNYQQIEIARIEYKLYNTFVI